MFSVVLLILLFIKDGCACKFCLTSWEEGVSLYIQCRSAFKNIEFFAENRNFIYNIIKVYYRSMYCYTYVQERRRSIVKIKKKNSPAKYIGPAPCLPLLVHSISSIISITFFRPIKLFLFLIPKNYFITIHNTIVISYNLCKGHSVQYCIYRC